MQINSHDDWVTAEQIVKRIKGDDVPSSADKYFKQNIACKPDFPKPSKFGATDVWCWGEISDYLRRKRDNQKPVGRPRKRSNYTEITPNRL